MASTGLIGPYDLTATEINRVVASENIGVYVLGHTGDDGTFYVTYVGRSDTDLNKRLHDWENHYKKFKYGYFQSTKAAFEKECQLYHDFEPPDNKIHPDRPNNTTYRCPVVTCPY